MRACLPATNICFVSTHLDDVALSCSHCLVDRPGTRCVTVMAGAPPIRRTHGWNAWTTGKTYAPDAVRVRRKEDAAALRRLRVEPIWLDLWDREYLDGRPRDEREVVSAIADALPMLGARSIAGPLGLEHPDHVAVSDACLLVARALDLELNYLDMPYAQKYPESAEARLRTLADRGLDLAPLEQVAPRSNAKRRAVSRYRSQCRKMHYASSEEVMTAPESFWKVAL